MVLLNSVVTMVAGISLILLVPGPTNSLLLVSGLKKGVLKSSPLIIAEVCGYITAIGFWAVLLSTIKKNVPSFAEIAKAACSIYIFFWRLRFGLLVNYRKVITIYRSLIWLLLLHSTQRRYSLLHYLFRKIFSGALMVLYYLLFYSY